MEDTGKIVSLDADEIAAVTAAGGDPTDPVWFGFRPPWLPPRPIELGNDIP